MAIVITRLTVLTKLIGMSSTIGTFSKINEAPIEIQELAHALESLPSECHEAMGPAIQRAIDCSIRRKRILNLVQEALAQLRLDMKYLIFDLEATRRERDDYREQIENQS